MIFELPSAGLKVYLLLLLVACIFKSIKLTRIWRRAVPFSHRPATGNPSYGQLLRVSAASLEHWINFTYLVSGIFASITVYQISDRLIANEGTNLILAMASLIRRLSFILTTGLLWLSTHFWFDGTLAGEFKILRSKIDALYRFRFWCGGPRMGMAGFEERENGH